MKKAIFTILLCLSFLSFQHLQSQIRVVTIDSARCHDNNNAPCLLNDTIQVRGIVTTHQELGASLVYFQDVTAGLNGYDATFCSGVTRGDSVQVTGVLTNYNGLYELQPVLNFSVLATNRTVTPVIVTPGQLRNPTGEQYMEMLVRVNGVTSIRSESTYMPVTTWTVSGSGTNYRLFVGNDSCEIRIYATSNLAGKPIPSYPFSVVALQSQYCTAPPYNTGYQIIPRDTSDILRITDIHQVSNAVPSKYSLYQNYPNPFNPVSVIKYSVESSSQIELKVYDVLGRDVAELVNSHQNPGTYEVTFDGTSYPSGVYFYSLFSDGKRFDSKKMVLSK